LKSANVAQLLEAGLPRSAMEVSTLCTITESSLLHSFRRDKERSGRMMAVLGLL
jgi:copper oxidase (laccase) domain-containing protein